MWAHTVGQDVPYICSSHARNSDITRYKRLILEKEQDLRPSLALFALEIWPLLYWPRSRRGQQETTAKSLYKVSGTTNTFSAMESLVRRGRGKVMVGDRAGGGGTMNYGAVKMAAKHAVKLLSSS